MAEEEAAPAFDSQSFLATLTRRPGVYRMINGDDTVLYVGKAKDLKRRVSSYFTRANSARIQSMVAQIRRVEVTVTANEAEALILESNLIKEFKPKYNVILRDDKSYPYIHVSDDPFPRISFHRGARKAGRYFGPYPSATSVRETLQTLQKLFPVRQCENSYYGNRSRACLQHQIKRCTGPCVGLVTEADYDRDVQDTVLFLSGKSETVLQRLGERMNQSSDALAFEEAARYRDQIAALRRVQERQHVSGEGGDLDIVALVHTAGMACIQVFFIRGGRNLGNRSLFPRVDQGADDGEIVAAFLTQFYADKAIPREIVLNIPPDDEPLLETALSERRGSRVKLKHRVRGERARWLKMAEQNAAIALEAKTAAAAGTYKRMEALRQVLDLDGLPERLECFDISHTQGQLTVASCVVFGPNGAIKSDYRRFNIQDITPGDDYAAMRQALERRYARIKSGEGQLPDVLFIDGGKGQLTVAAEVMNELAISGVTLVGVAKGADRRPGLEQLFLWGQDTASILPSNAAALHLIQQIRDEAHRFAITGHRQRRGKSQTKSVLEEIPGIGPKRRRRLLTAFGGIQGISRAGVEDLAAIEGINDTLAEQIYAAFHSQA